MEHDGEIRDEAALLRAAADDRAAFARFYRHHVHGVTRSSTATRATPRPRPT